MSDRSNYAGKLNNQFALGEMRDTGEGGTSRGDGGGSRRDYFCRHPRAGSKIERRFAISIVILCIRVTRYTHIHTEDQELPCCDQQRCSAVPRRDSLTITRQKDRFRRVAIQREVVNPFTSRLKALCAGYRARVYMAAGPVKSRRTYISLMDERDTVDSGIRSGIVKLFPGRHCSFHRGFARPCVRKKRARRKY